MTGTGLGLMSWKKNPNMCSHQMHTKQKSIHCANISRKKLQGWIYQNAAHPGWADLGGAGGGSGFPPNILGNPMGLLHTGPPTKFPFFPTQSRKKKKSPSTLGLMDSKGFGQLI